ncbi:hypothetical protein ACFOWE_30465, partial [Planomonospora corallina]
MAIIEGRAPIAGAARTAPATVAAPAALTPRTPAAYAFGVARIALGWVFLWAFLDKMFGLGFATPAA